MYATQTNGSDLGIEVSYTAASPNNNFLNHQKSMSNNIKPSEVSEVLLQQLKDLATDVKFEEVGVVLTVGDGVARIYGLTKVTENELLEFENGVMGVAMNLEEETWAQSF